jgi:hypothetical protein
VIYHRVKTVDARDWYADGALEHGWFAPGAGMQIETDARGRTGSA